MCIKRDTVGKPQVDSECSDREYQLLVHHGEKLLGVITVCTDSIAIIQNLNLQTPTLVDSQTKKS